MNKKAFTLIELLAVIIILAIIFRIAIPIITGMMDTSKKNAFADDARMVIKAIQMEKLIDDDFIETSITEDNVASELDISDVNFQTITVTLVSGKVNIVIVGKEKWAGLTATGTYDNMVVQ